ncbi:MAG: hypothetical protein K5770_07850 [Lachnospiraceae bacterium]|nr:hypothetical protein [Lachnospiraceae bacterium]
MLDKQSMTCSSEDFNDLAQFMMQGKDEDNLRLIERYLGKSKKQGPGGFEGQDIMTAMDSMMEQLFSIDISVLNLENDTEMVKNAAVLEKIASQTAAFERMVEKHNYFGSLDQVSKDTISLQLDSLRSIAAYYNTRKEIIHNKYYKEHYNEELSMNMKAAGTEDERRLAEKLVESHILGRIMMRVNGVDIASVNKRGKPGFTDPEMQRIYEEKRKNLKKRDTQKKLTRDAFIQKDAIAGASLKETNVYKNEKVNALKEEKKQLAKKALDNMLSIKGRKLAEPDSAPDEFTEEKLESDLKELEQISASDVKFSSYAEMINNFGHNMAICERAEEIHFNLVRGIARGVKIPDERMKELRAKLLFLHEVRYTMTVINKALATDENFTGKTDEEWSRSIKNSRTKNGQLKKLYLVPGDVEAMFAKCRENVNNEFEKRDDYIKAVWKMMHSTYKTETVIKNGREETEESVTAAGEIPAEELERRRAEYQSNQAASEFLNRNSELSNSMGHVRAVMEAYCKKNGLTYNEPPRLISSYLKDKSASEIIRFYKLYSGTAGDKFRCWKEIDEAVNKVPLKDFDTRDLARWTDNYYRTSAMAIVHANANDISKEMKKLIEDRKNRGWLKVPSRYRDMEEMERKYNILYGFGCSYTSGRLNALQQTDASSYRGALSIKELGSIDAANMDNILKVLMYYENQGVETEEFENIQKLINQAQFIGPEIKTRPLSEADRRAGKLMERASFDTDIEELYKEESDAYDLKHLPEVNAEINNITSSLNKTLEKYREKTGTDVWRQKYHSHGDREGRVARYMTNCMAYLKKYDEKQALELYDGLMIDTKKNVGPEEKQRRSRSFERIFEELLTFDLTKFNFEDPKEFIRPDKKDVRVFGSMVWDMHTDEFDAYEDLIDDKDAQCALTKEQLNEVRARWELFQVISRWAGQVPLSAEIPEAREFDMLDILNNKSLEEIRQIMNDNKSPGMALYISGLMYLKDTLSKGFGPKTDAAGLLKEYRKKYGINGDRHGKEALEAIRKKLAKK